MNKSLRLYLVLPLLLYANQAICVLNKTDKLEAIFSAKYHKEQMIKQFSPLQSHFFGQFTFVDDKTKQETETKVFEAYYDLVKKSFIEEFGKRFEEGDLDEILVFYNTAVGKKLNEKMFDVDLAVGKACVGFFAKIQEIIVKSGGKPATAADQGHVSKAVIYFEDLAKKDTKTPACELFEKIVASEGVCAVKFSATWCPPCRTYKPVFEGVAEHYKELNKCTIKYIAVDTDQVPAVAQAYKVTSIPVTIFFKNGEEAARFVGALSKEDLVAKLQEITSAQ